MRRAPSRAPRYRCSVVADPLAGTTPPRAGFELDTARLEAHLREHVEGFRGPLEVRQFSGGQSNPTYLIGTPERRYVLRRKPPGQLLASAHAVDREYRVITALGRHSDVPVARTFTLCTDDSVIGTWFYVMEHVEGRIFWDAGFPEVSREARPGYFDAMNAAIASLHNVDYSAAGLADFGRPGGYFARQIARWAKQYREDTAAGRIAAMDRVIEWLAAHIPPGEEASVVHGDYRCDNVIFHPTEPRVLAILDWELATIGHPLADFGYHLTTWRMPPIGIAGLAGRDLAELNIPSESQYVEAYCRRTGREDIPHLDFYLAFSFFRLAGIFHGIRGRVVRGTAVNARAREYAKHVETIAELAWQQAERAG
ncbi:MAG: phosphotransferase [Gammaproteobacteria bacterium]